MNVKFRYSYILRLIFIFTASHPVGPEALINVMQVSGPLQDRSPVAKQV